MSWPGTIQSFFLLSVLPLLLTGGTVLAGHFPSSDPVALESLPAENATSLTIPASALQQSKDGRLLLNSGGSDRYDPKDDYRTRPRPFFMDKGTMGLYETASWLDQMMARVARVLDQPMTENDRQRQRERLDQLDSVLASFRLQQAISAASDHLDLPPVMPGLRRHPGYQEHHPAHLGSYRFFSVPGTAKEGDTGQSATPGDSGENQSGATTSAFSSPSARGYSPGRESGRSDGPGGGGFPPPDRNPEKTSPDWSVNCAQQSYHVYKELDDGTQLETFIPEQLYCSICMDLGRNKAAQCSECEKAVCCLEHVNQYGLNECPSCRNTGTAGQGRWYKEFLRGRAICNLVWFCADGCGVSGVESAMRGHKTQCTAPPENHKSCPNEGCTVTGSELYLSSHAALCDFILMPCRHSECHAWIPRKDLQAHEAGCQYRLVDLGVYSVAFYKKQVIEAVPAPEDGCQDNAQMAVAFLLSLVQSRPENTEDIASDDTPQTVSDDTFQNEGATPASLATSDFISRVSCRDCRELLALNTECIQLGQGQRLQALPDTPGVFVSAITAPYRCPGQDFFLKANFAGFTINECNLRETVCSRGFYYHDVNYFFEVRIVNHYVYLDFGYIGHQADLYGSWRLDILNHEGHILAIDFVEYSEIAERGGSYYVLTNYPVGTLQRGTPFWSYPENFRIVFFWLGFIPR